MPDTFQIYQSELTGPELDEALKNIALVQQSVADAAQSVAAAGESAADAAQAAQTAETYGAIVQQNQPAIQDIADNLAAVQGAAQNAQTAQSAATEAAASAQEAEQWAEQAQQIAQGAMGWYADPQALQSAHPTGQAGNWAIVGSTDTIWVWDTDTNAWVNTGNQIDLSNYYQKQEADARFQMPIGYVFEWASVPEQSVDLSTPEKVAQYFGYGTWAAFGAGQFLLGAGGSYQAGNTGGEAKHVFSISEMPSHTHQIAYQDDSSQQSISRNASTSKYVSGWRPVSGTIIETGGGQPHNNMPPYIVVYRWQRIA